MSSDLHQQMRDFVIVFEQFELEQLDQIPYWTKVNHVAQISPSEFAAYNRNQLISHELVKSLPKSKLVKGRRIFDTAQTPTRQNSPRTVSFSPRVDIQPIEKNKRRNLTEQNTERQAKKPPPKRSPASPLSQVIHNIDEARLDQQNGQSSGPRGEALKLAEELEILNEDLLDLVPPDFDIIDSNPLKLYVAPATNDCDSDSVSYLTSDEDEDDNDSARRNSFRHSK